MKRIIELRRSAAMPFAPAPKAVQAGDYVFTSAIYPVDEQGHAIAVDEALGEAGPSAHRSADPAMSRDVEKHPS